MTSPSEENGNERDYLDGNWLVKHLLVNLTETPDQISQLVMVHTTIATALCAILTELQTGNDILLGDWLSDLLEEELEEEEEEVV